MDQPVHRSLLPGLESFGPFALSAQIDDFGHFRRSASPFSPAPWRQSPWRQVPMISARLGESDPQMRYTKLHTRWSLRTNTYSAALFLI